jgi:hypothetical protein
MIGFLQFGDARTRLLALAHGCRALEPASIYRAPDGRFHVELPGSPITDKERWAAHDAIVFSLRAGDNAAYVLVGDIPQRLGFSYWYSVFSKRLDPQDDEGRAVLIDEARFEAWLSDSNVLEVLRTSECAEAPVAELPERPRRGPKKQYDWVSFRRELVSIANTGKGLPEIQADLVRHMLQWCENEWGREPAESMVKLHISKFYKEG